MVNVFKTLEDVLLEPANAMKLIHLASYTVPALEIGLFHFIHNTVCFFLGQNFILQISSLERNIISFVRCTSRFLTYNLPILANVTSVCIKLRLLGFSFRPDKIIAKPLFGFVWRKVQNSIFLFYLLETVAMMRKEINVFCLSQGHRILDFVDQKIRSCS